MCSKLVTSIFLFLSIFEFGWAEGVPVVTRWSAAEAKQGVAVDGDSFFAIGNAVIGKYDKRTGKKLQTWNATDELPLTHLNSGVVIDGKLYCAHSNYPAQPEASSVEIFDAKTLQHLGNHSFGIYEGSLTWIDRHDGAWWAVFAHYSKNLDKNPYAKPHTYTTLIKFDSQWRRLGGWVFPKVVLNRFHPYSCSGGAWSADGRLFCTGHDHRELYELEIPRAGSTLEFVRTIPVEITGQGIAWDPASPKTLYGINRPERQVIVLCVNRETE